MSDDTEDMARFASEARSQIAGALVIIGPACVDGREDARLIEIAGAARSPNAERPFATLIWRYRVAGDHADQSQLAWGTVDFLAELLKRDFATVEVCGNQLEFTRAIERRWPCALSTAARERFEEKERRRIEWDRRRVEHICQREREGMSSTDAYLEFLRDNPPDG